VKSKLVKFEKQSSEPEVKGSAACIICGKPATRMVDGDPSCEEHAELVYEDQLEKYTQRHLSDHD
jgi:hypothetical protein